MFETLERSTEQCLACRHSVRSLAPLAWLAAVSPRRITDGAVRRALEPERRAPGLDSVSALFRRLYEHKLGGNSGGCGSLNFQPDTLRVLQARKLSLLESQSTNRGNVRHCA
jgi:hypothetical protein